MKHLLRVLFALLAIFAITACAHDNEATEEDENEMPTEDEIQRLIEQAKRGKIPGGYEEPEEPATTEEAFDTMRCMGAWFYFVFLMVWVIVTCLTHASYLQFAVTLSRT
jgi:hypothetical protein